MENKVIILGAGIGAMTMGFENAGCSVVAAYEKDRRAIELYKKNISDEINETGSIMGKQFGRYAGYRYFSM